MRVIRDLMVGNGPVPFDIWYNGDLAADSTTLRYRGSLCKVMDYNDIDHGVFVTFAGLTTAMENVCGILEEEHGTSGNYLPDDATYGVQRRKMTPIFPSTVIRAEYAQKDAAGTDNRLSGMTGSAGGTSLTISITTADTMIGGWIYFLTGANAGYLHYVTDNNTTTMTVSALANAVASGDYALAILPPVCRRCDFDATYTGIKSIVDDNSMGDTIVGIEHWISAPGIGMTKLDRNKHNGLKIDGAKFYHDFVIPGSKHAWVSGITTS